MDDLRVPFDEAEKRFRDFLHSQGVPDAVLWLSRERVVGHGRRFWVFRPEELASPAASRAFYESTRRTPASIRFDAVATIGGRSLAFVHDYGGSSRKLNFGVATEPWDVRPISSRLAWVVLRVGSRLGRSTPFLRTNRITGSTTPSDATSVDAPAV